MQETASREGEWFLERSQIVGRLGSYRLEVASGAWVSSRGLDDLLGIVKQSGGQITVSSQPGQGTTFEVYLPMSVGNPRAPAPGVVGARLTGHETVLLVED